MYALIRSVASIRVWLLFRGEGYHIYGSSPGVQKTLFSGRFSRSRFQIWSNIGPVRITSAPRCRLSLDVAGRELGEGNE